MGINIGDTVEWTSQSKSRRKKKRGVVIALVSGQNAKQAAHDYRITWNDYDLSPIRGCGMMRSHESYLVKVECGNRKPKIYWPLVSALMVIEEA